MMKSKVVLINQTSGYLMIDIVNAYSESYNQVILITGTIEEFSRKLKASIIIEPICRYNRKSLFSRFFSWCYATLQIFFLLLFKYRDVKVVYVTNPPMSYFSSLFLKNEYSIIVYDIYPDALLSIGIKRDSLIFKLWTKINRKIFNRAYKIYTLSTGMAKLLSNYCDINNILIIPNWGGFENLSPISKDRNRFVKEHNLKDKFVVMYSGNMGVTHNVEVMLDLAREFKNNEFIVFYFIGEGAKKSELMEIVKREFLNNCFFLTWQKSEEVKYSLSAADLSIITLTADAAQVSVPSKTYNLLAVGSPILCIASQEAEVSRLIEGNCCGKCFSKDEKKEMVNFIEKLLLDKEYCKTISNNSLKASLSYTWLNAKNYVC